MAKFGRRKWNEKDPDEIAFMQAAGKRFRYQRKKFGINQTDLGRRLNYSPSPISRFEAEGKPLQIHIVAKACILFGCSLDTIFGLDLIKK